MRGGEVSTWCAVGIAAEQFDITSPWRDAEVFCDRAENSTR